MIYIYNAFCRRDWDDEGKHNSEVLNYRCKNNIFLICVEVEEKYQILANIFSIISSWHKMWLKKVRKNEGENMKRSEIRDEIYDPKYQLITLAIERLLIAENTAAESERSLKRKQGDLCWWDRSIVMSERWLRWSFVQMLMSRHHFHSLRAFSWKLYFCLRWAYVGDWLQQLSAITMMLNIITIIITFYTTMFNYYYLILLAISQLRRGSS